MVIMSDGDKDGDNEDDSDGDDNNGHDDGGDGDDDHDGDVLENMPTTHRAFLLLRIQISRVASGEPMAERTAPCLVII